MANKLYIIGNGFDRYHNIPSSYSDFKAWCQRNDLRLYNYLSSFHLDEDALWSDFENELGNIDADAIIEYAKVGNREWNTSYKGLYRFHDEVKDTIDDLKTSLQISFLKWVIEFNNAPTSLSDAPLQTADSLFVSFNYTNTLEKLYHIPNGRICYIHGKAIDEFSDLVFGHGKSKEEIMSAVNADDGNIFEETPREDVAEMLMSLAKPTESCIKQHHKLFESIGKIDEVYIVGFSCSDVDFPYMEKIKEAVSTDAKWCATYYDRIKDIPKIIQLFDRLGIHDSNRQLLTIKELWKCGQPSLLDGK